jgi:hypothetical protein
MKRQLLAGRFGADDLVEVSAGADEQKNLPATCCRRLYWIMALAVRLQT